MSERLATRIETFYPPAYFAAVQVEAEVQQKLLDTLLGVPQVRMDLDPLETGQASDEWIDSVICNEDGRALAERKRQILQGLLRDARSRQQTVLQDPSIVARVLRVHHDELTKLLDQVKTISDTLGAVDNAEAAVAADLGPQWKQLAAFADEYDALRRSQASWTPTTDKAESVPTRGGEEHASNCYIRNLDEVWPGWREPSLNPVRHQNVYGERHRYEPWPVDRIQLLLWLVRSDAQPWAPTPAQLQTLRRERRERLNPSPAVIAGRPDRQQREPHFATAITANEKG